MSNSPKVVVVNMFTPSFKNLNYKYPTKDKIQSSTMNMFDYYADNKKKAFFMLDYFQGKFGKDKEMNIMFENGEYATKTEILRFLVAHFLLCLTNFRPKTKRTCYKIWHFSLLVACSMRKSTRHGTNPYSLYKIHATKEEIRPF